MTVGIVLVSHSAPLARGAAELSRQMAGDVAVEPAGGLDDPGEPLGTDAVRVADAIGRADSGDGVLVLMDLGSALLSAETALDLAGGVDRDRVRLSAAPLIEGAVAAAAAAATGAALDEVSAEAGRGLAGKQAHLGEDAVAHEPPPTASGAGVSAEVEVRNRLGLHARPAARLVRAMAAFDADVRIANHDTNRGPVPARSLTGLATLGAVRGHRLEVTASGTDAHAAVDEVRRMAADGFGDRDESSAPTEQLAAKPGAGGLASAPGSADGPVRHLRPPEIPEADRTPGTAAEEATRLQAAVTAVRDELVTARDGASRVVGTDAAGILDAQVLLLDDAAVVDAANAATGEGATAEGAWRQAIAPVADAYRNVDDDYLRARADDVDDVTRRVLAHLAGVPTAPVLSSAGIVVADALGPADTAALDRELARGILTARGTPTGHAAILARSLGIPAVVGAGPAVLRLAEGRRVLIDGDTGAVHVDPGDAVVREYAERRTRAAAEHRSALASAHEPAATTDGRQIAVRANVGSLADAKAAAVAGADGIGLLRTEFLFTGREDAPSEDEQAAAYAEIAGCLDGRPVHVRTFDIGADKPAAYLRQEPEDNPFLGVRGLRLALARPEVLAAQLRAISRTARVHAVDVLLPMVTTLDELDAVRRLLGGEGVRLGVMVEVPGVALQASAFAGRVDFWSMGTNDLVQYTLAAERGNASVAGIADPCHPGVLALIRRVADAGAAAGIETAVCGEMASDSALAALLVGLGVTELSVTPAILPEVKQAVRRASYAEARQLADDVLQADSAAEVRALL